MKTLDSVNKTFIDVFKLVCRLSSFRQDIKPFLKAKFLFKFANFSSRILLVATHKKYRVKNISQ